MKGIKGMKVIKGIISVAFAGAFVVSAACANSTQSSDSEPVVKPVETEYVDKVESPDYAEISESIVYKTYYFDSEHGDDTNDGLSKDKAKQSLHAANTLVETIQADVPTKILFKAGSVYEGTLQLVSYQAAKESPLIVSAYDVTEEEPYATIIAPDKGSSIVLKGDNVRISKFECTSDGGKGYRGIYATTARKGAAENIVISDNWCHDFNFLSAEKYELPTDLTDLTPQQVMEISPEGRYARDCGGIVFEANTPKAKGPSWYQNVWLDNNKIDRVSRTGIWFNTMWAYRPPMSWGINPYYDDNTNYFPHQNIYIRGNDLTYTGGDGIVLLAAKNSIIEYNTCYHAQICGRSGYANAGIWTHSCSDTVIQFNEAAYTHYRYDGQGFDIDIANRNILFQYNYAHNNWGGGLLLCNTGGYSVQYDQNGDFILDEDGCPVQKYIIGEWHDIVVKNNVFVDNRWADIIFSGKVDDILVENNTIVKLGNAMNGYEQKDQDQGLVIESKDFSVGVPGTNWTIRNNIFYSRKVREGSEYQFQMKDFSKEYLLENNVYYGFSDGLKETMLGYGEKNYREIDPQFLSMEAGIGFEYAKGFIPTNPEIYKKAEKLPLLLKYDFLGNNVTGVSYYGAIGAYKAN